MFSLILFIVCFMRYIFFQFSFIISISTFHLTRILVSLLLFFFIIHSFFNTTAFIFPSFLLLLLIQRYSSMYRYKFSFRFSFIEFSFKPSCLVQVSTTNTRVAYRERESKHAEMQTDSPTNLAFSGLTEDITLGGDRDGIALSSHGVPCSACVKQPAQIGNTCSTQKHQNTRDARSKDRVACACLAELVAE